MITKNKEKIILKYLYNRGTTYSRDLEKFFDKKIPRSTFFHYLKQLKNKELIQIETINEATRKRIKYSITDKGIEEIRLEVEEPIIKLEIDIKDIEFEFFPLIEKLETKYPLNVERKFIIFLTWPYIKNNIPNLIQNKDFFCKIKLFLLLNQLNYNLEIKDLISYSNFSKLFNINKVELRFYIQKLIEQSNYLDSFPDLHKLSINEDKDIFYSYSFGFGKILYSLIIFFMKSDLSFNPILNLFPREFIGEPSIKLQEKLENLLNISSIEQFFEHFFDFEKEITKIFPQNLKFFIKKFFKTNYLNSIITYTRNIPYKKLYETQKWRKKSGELIFSNFMNLFNKTLIEKNILRIKENLAMMEVIGELKIFFEIDKYLLDYYKKENRIKKLNSINSYLKYLNERLGQIIDRNKNLYQDIDKVIKDQEIDIHLEKFKTKHDVILDENDLKFLQLTRTYSFEVNRKLKNKALKQIRIELRNLTDNLE